VPRLTPLIPLLQETARFQREAFASGEIDFDTKGVNNFVSDVDRTSQRMILQAIREHDPQAGILAEEDGGDQPPSGSNRWYVVDPLDGTGNFKARIPIWGISVGMIENDALVEGVIVDSHSGQVWTSWEAKPLPQLATQLDQVEVYALDSVTENRFYPEIARAKRRQIGATVLADLLLTQPAFEGRASVDFALMGNSALWDIAGPAAFLRQVGGIFLVDTGAGLHDLTREPISALCPDGLGSWRHKKLHYVASASPELAQAVIDAGYMPKAGGGVSATS